MKKILLLLVISWTCLSSVKTQEVDQKFRLELSSRGMFTQYDRSQTGGIYKANPANILNYALDLSIFFPINKRFDIGAGLGFANRDVYVFNYIPDYCLCIGSGSGYKPIDVYDYARIRSIEVPIALRVKWFKQEKKINPYFSIGFTYGIPLKYRLVDEKWQGGVTGNQFFIGLNLSMGATIPLTENWNLILAGGVLENNYVGVPENEFFWLEPSGEKLDEWFLKVGVSREF